MRDGATVASERVLGLFGREFYYFAFVDFLSFLDTETCCACLAKPSFSRAYVEDIQHRDMNGERADIPIARLKFSIRASVFFTSAEYISLPTMGQKGTLVPNS